MRNLLLLVLVGVVVSGCATRRDLDISRYLNDAVAQTEQGVSGGPAGPDAPEAPVSGLPPPSMGGGDVDAGELAPGEALIIQPDCLLMINVAEDSSLNGSYTVNSLGAVQLGYVGPVFLFNKTEREAARKIADALKMRHFSKATVSVKILRASYDKVEISGAVNRPGIVQIGAGDSISMHDLLLRSGGIKGSAVNTQVRVIREGLRSPLKYSLPAEDFYLADEDGNPSVPNIVLRNDDLVHVVTGTGRAKVGSGNAPVAAERIGPKTILVLGEVKRKGFVSFGAGEPCTMMRLLFKMGGLPPYAKSKAVRVIRRNDDGFEEEIIVDAKAIMAEGNPDDDFPLEDGDRVIVPARRISLF